MIDRRTDTEYAEESVIKAFHRMPMVALALELDDLHQEGERSLAIGRAIVMGFTFDRKPVPVDGDTVRV